MKLNIDLIRSLLLEIEEKRVPNSIYQRKWTNEEAEHLYLLETAGMIEAAIQMAAGSVIAMVVVKRLAMPGHDFIVNIRDEKIYQEMKKSLLSKVKDVSIEIYAQFAVEYTKKLVQG